MPVDAPIIAIVVLLLLQVPPAVTSVNVIVRPTQTLPAPFIDDGKVLTVTVASVIQPVGSA
jgi:hypothetical protein